MENQCKILLNLELGHRAQVREKETSEDFSHEWTVFVRRPETGHIQHLVEKVVFHLHESYPKPKRVFKEPPYKVVEFGSEGFLMFIEVYFKNKERLKKMSFKYNLFLNPEGDHLRCEKLIFNNPTKEFRRKLIKAGGVRVVPEGSEAVSWSTSDSPMSPLKKIKTSHGSEEPSKEGSGSSSQAAQADQGTA